MNRYQILEEVSRERERQHEKWGLQILPDGTGRQMDKIAAKMAQAVCADAFSLENYNPSWRVILAEEVAEAFAESDPEKLRAELVQVAAVAVQWIECIDSRVECGAV